MNVLIIGQGGREHALAWKCLKSANCEHAYVMPGNPGMLKTENLTCLEDQTNSIETLLNTIQLNHIELVIIGPENILAQGLSDQLRQNSILVVGPSQTASQLETSKIFAKEFMQTHQIPTAAFDICDSFEKAKELIEQWPYQDEPVIKLDGLASGKGVFLPKDKFEAINIIHDLFQNEDYPLKTDKILLEQRVTGKEVSAFILCDGKNYINLGIACDYKRLFNNDQGPITGGMGCYIPENITDKVKIEDVNQVVFNPVIKGMAESGSPFQGFLFAGLMVNDDKINVLEFNVRMGDPETQTLLPTLSDNFFDACVSAAKETLASQESITVRTQKSVHVVMTSGGYSEIGKSMDTGYPILGLNTLNEKELYFSAGISCDSQGEHINTGGRVLGITTLADTIKHARIRTYQAISKIHFENCYYRTDIAQREVE